MVDHGQQSGDGGDEVGALSDDELAEDWPGADVGERAWVAVDLDGQGDVVVLHYERSVSRGVPWDDSTRLLRAVGSAGGALLCSDEKRA